MPEIFFLEDITNEAVNPYEAVTAASQEARRINQARLMLDTSEDGDKPTTLALRRLSKGKVAVKYAGDGAGESEEDRDGTVEQDAEGSAGS